MECDLLPGHSILVTTILHSATAPSLISLYMGKQLLCSPQVPPPGRSLVPHNVSPFPIPVAVPSQSGAAIPPRHWTLR